MSIKERTLEKEILIAWDCEIAGIDQYTGKYNQFFHHIAKYDKLLHCVPCRSEENR